MRRLAILGSTGSIGTQALSVAQQFPDRVRIAALAARRDVDGLFAQVRQYRPEVCCMVDESAARELRERLRVSGLPCRVLTGIDGLSEIAGSGDVDVVLVSVVGAAALGATLTAVKAGKRVAFASKEVLVAAGHLVMGEAAKTGAEILPVDSEHSAIFQCLDGERHESIRRVILTASGGPFLDYTAEQLRAVTVEQALAHPTWQMGSKITVDSASLMNKGLEVIEAHWLFGVDLARVEVVVHRQSIIHSLVEFADRSMLAQMGLPNMCLPIQYALFYPERLANNLQPLDLASVGALSFERPDTGRFPCLRLAYDAARAGGSMPCALNAANEVSVDLFLKGRVSFPGIAAINETVMERHSVMPSPDLEEVLAADAWARAEALRVAERLEGGI